MIEGTLKASSLGPKRKYYHVTDKGLEQLEEFKQSWGMVSTTVNNLLQGVIGMNAQDMIELNNKT